MRWETVETLGYSYYTEREYTILIPLVKSRRYDFVAEKDGEFKRVNVKLAGLKDKSKPDSWSIAMAGDGTGDKRDAMQRKLNTVYVDIYLVWMPNLGRFIELPGNFFVGHKSKAVRIPKSYYLD